VEEMHCIGNCPAGSHSAENRTCISCPLGTYQPSDGQKDCLSCGQGLTTSSKGATNQSQCIETVSPSSDISATEEQSTVTTSPSIFETSVTEVLPTKDTGQTEEQENNEELPRKIPVIVVGSLVVLFLIILLVACCIKKRRKKGKKDPSNPIDDCHSNPTYDASEYKPSDQTEDNELAPPEWSESLSDLTEQWYEDIRNKDVVDEFADDPTYDYVDPPQKGNHNLSFVNQSYLPSSET